MDNKGETQIYDRNSEKLDPGKFLEMKNSQILKADFFNNFKFEIQSPGIYFYRVGKVVFKFNFSGLRDNSL